MKKTALQFLFIFSLILLLHSCASSKKIVYFQDIEGMELKDSILNFEAKIEIGDMLFINVSATDAEAAIPFNLSESPSGGEGSVSSPLNYLVNTLGVINFPVLGKIAVAGLTTNQLTEKLEDLLLDYIKDPIINILITNFKVSIIGEVNSPGSFEVTNSRISIIEAIGLAGDLTIYGKRKTVLLIREVSGKKEFVTLDLTNKKIFDSPYYYLKQNDVIYVAPNKPRVNGSAVDPSITLIFSSVTMFLAIYAIFAN